MKRRLYILLPLGALGAVALLLALIDPMASTIPLPRCPIKWLTGYDCPGCGSTRALHALLHGRPLEALRFNLWLPVAAIAAIIAFAAELRGGKWARRVLSPAPLICFVILSLAWGVVRNML